MVDMDMKFLPAIVFFPFSFIKFISWLQKNYIKKRGLDEKEMKTKNKWYGMCEIDENFEKKIYVSLLCCAILFFNCVLAG